MQARRGGVRGEKRARRGGKKQNFDHCDGASFNFYSVAAGVAWPHSSALLLTLPKAFGFLMS